MTENLDKIDKLPQILRTLNPQIIIFHVLRKPDGLLLQALPRKKKKKKTQTFYPRICEMMGKEKKKNRGEGKEEGVASCPTKRPEF